MADAIHRVGIEIDVDSGNIAARIKAIEKQLKAMEKTVARMDKKGTGVNDRFNRLDKTMNKLQNTVKGVTSLFVKFFTALAKFGFLAMAGEIAIFSAALLGVKLALITGRAAASLYNIALKGLSVTAASVATGLATAAAAMRQFQEAQLSPFLGGGFKGNARAATLGRGMGAGTAGLFGGEGTQQVVASLARAGIGGGRGIRLAQSLGALTNFDPKATAQIVSALGGAQRGQGLAPAISAITGAVGFRQGASISASNAAGLIGLINSGSITNPAFAQQGANLQGTLIGTAKTQFVGIKDMFADAGVGLLEPMRQSFLQIAQILRENFLSLSVIIQRFGADSMGPTMVTIFDRMMKFITTNIIDHLDNIKEMGENFVGFFRAIRNFFVGMGDFLGRYEPAANVIIDMFKAASNANKSSLFRDFSQGLVDNKEQIKKFGSGLGRLFGGVFDLFSRGNKGFFGGIDKIVEVFDTITDKVLPALVKLSATLEPLIERIPTILEGIANAIEILTPFVSTMINMVAGLIDLFSVGGGGLLGLGALGFMGARGKAGKGIGGAVKKSGGMRNFVGGQGGAMGLLLNGMMVMGGANMVGSTLGDAFYNRPGALSFNNFAKAGIGGGLAAGGLAGMAAAAGMTGVGLPVAIGLGIAAGVLAIGSTAVGGMVLRALGIGGKDPKKVYRESLQAGLSGYGGITADYFFTDVHNAAPATRMYYPGTNVLNPFIGFYGTASGGTFGPSPLEGVGRMEQGLGIGSRRDKFNTMKRQRELLGLAIEEYARTGSADNDTFRNFLLSMGHQAHGIDDYDALFRSYTVGFDTMGISQNTLNNFTTIESLQQNNARGTVVGLLGEFADALDTSIDSLQIFAEDFNLDFMNMTFAQSATLGMIYAASQLDFSMDRVVMPDITNTGINRNTLQKTAGDKLTAIMMGDRSPAAIMDFFTAQTQFEIGMGVSPIVAGLSGPMMLALRRDAGQFGAVGSDGYLEMDNVITESFSTFFTGLSAETKIPVSQLEAAFKSGGLDGLSAFLLNTQGIRRAFGATTNMTFEERLPILMANGLAFGGTSQLGQSNVESFLNFLGIEGNLGINTFDTPEQILEKVGAGITAGKLTEEDLRQAGVNMLVDAGIVESNGLIAEALNALAGNIQYWELNFNEGSAGEPGEIFTIGPDGVRRGIIIPGVSAPEVLED